MCCLFGMMGANIVGPEHRIMEAMSYLSCFRGVDSTGVIIGSRGKKLFEINTEKDTVTPPEFFHGDEFRRAMANTKGQTVLLAGHARAATKGQVTVKNAHPFEVGNIIGMHNGTIHGLNTGDGTDSEAALKILDQNGLQDTVDRCKFGAYAFMWVDSTDATVNFIRNKERPLHFMKAPGGLLLWMSEKWMLECIRERFRWDEKHSDILSLNEDTHVKFNMGNIHCKSVQMKPKDTPFHFSELFKGEKGKPVLSVDWSRIYPYGDTYTGQKFSTSKPKEVTSSVVPLLPSPPKAANLNQQSTEKKLSSAEVRRQLRRVGPWPDCTDEDLDRIISEGCINCNTKAEIDPSTHTSLFKSTVYFLPSPNKLVDQTVYFCFDCKKKEVHKKDWYLDDRDLVRGGLTLAAH